MWLDHAYLQTKGSLEALKVEPLFRKLHGDPRFGALLRKAKLAETRAARAGIWQFNCDWPLSSDSSPVRRCPLLAYGLNRSTQQIGKIVELVFRSDLL